MKNLLKTTSLILIIFSFFVTSGHAFSVEDSEFEVKIHWEIEDPGLGDQFSFGFNPDGTFGVGMPDLGEEYGEYGEYVELPIKSIPDLDLAINWIEAVWEDADTTLKIWGSVSEYVLESDKLEQPLRVQTFSGDGEVTIFQGGNERYYPFAFFGSDLPEEKEAEFLQALPGRGLQGEMDKDITIFCASTEFQSPGVAFENRGIRINSTEIVNNTSLKVNIDIDKDAPRGKSDIIISLNDGNMIIGKNAFEVKGVL